MSNQSELEREAMLSAIVEHLGPHALTHGKMSVYDAFCLGWVSRSDLALQGDLKAELQCCKELMEELLEYVEPPPDKNCTCFIAPPCSDCVDYAHLRELIELSRAAIERLNGVKS